MKPYLLYSWLQFIALHLLASACMTPLICTDSGAFQNGRQQALQGLAPDLGVGASCKDEDAQTFRSKYEQGYQTGYSTLCSAESVGAEARKSGLNGVQQTSLPIRYQICKKEIDTLKTAYAENYRQGLAVFCTPETAASAGFQNGKDGGQSEFSLDSIAACGPQRQSAYRAAYQTAYQKGLKEFCSASRIEETGYQQGVNYQNQIDIRQSYPNCSDAELKHLAARYQQSYRQGLRAYCVPGNHMEMLKQWVLTEEQPTFTVERYQSCVDNFPDFWNQYRETYLRERAQFVQNNCSFVTGLQAGRRSAEEYTDYEAQVPKFCNASTLPSYQQGFDTGWREVKERICSPNILQERGYQDGQQGLQANAPIPSACSATMRLSLENSYRLGYDRGLRLFQLQNQVSNQTTPSTPQPQAQKRQCRYIYPVHGPLPSRILQTGPGREVLYPNGRSFMRVEYDGSFQMFYPDEKSMLRLNAAKDQLLIYWPNGTQLRYPQNKNLGRTLFLPDNTLWYLEVDDPRNQRLNASPYQTFSSGQTKASYQWDNRKQDVFRAELNLPEGLLLLEIPAATNRLVIRECLP